MSLTSATWDEIGKTQPAGDGWIVRRLHPESRHAILAARRGLNGDIGLVFEITTRSLPSNAALPDCVGFKTIIETIVPGPGGSCRVCLVLKDRRYLEIFATLANDIVERILPLEEEPVTVRAILARLNTWQRFLEKFGLNLLSSEEQTGLFAELLLLELEFIPSLGPATAVRSWRGPFGEPHDFLCGDTAVEVKAATTRDPAAFLVANLQQLDQGSAARLFLAHVSLVTDKANGRSLPELVARVRATLAAIDPGAASDFEASLQEAGFLDMHADAYRERRLAEKDRHWFEVTAGFPRLTAGSVPDGVLSARYSVSLARCFPFLIDSRVPSSLLKSRTP